LDGTEGCPRQFLGFFSCPRFPRLTSMKASLFAPNPSGNAWAANSVDASAEMAREARLRKRAEQRRAQAEIRVFKGFENGHHVNKGALRGTAHLFADPGPTVQKESAITRLEASQSILESENGRAPEASHQEQRSKERRMAAFAEKRHKFLENRSQGLKQPQYDCSSIQSENAMNMANPVSWKAIESDERHQDLMQQQTSHLEQNQFQIPAKEPQKFEENSMRTASPAQHRFAVPNAHAWDSNTLEQNVFGDPRQQEMEKKREYARQLQMQMEEKKNRIQDREHQQHQIHFNPSNTVDHQHEEAEKKREYARQLEEQIQLKKSKEWQARESERMAERQSEPLVTDEWDKKREYARQLEEQIRFKKAQEMRKREAERIEMSQMQPSATDDWNKKQNYAMELERQINEKKMREFEERRKFDRENQSNTSDFSSQQQQSEAMRRKLEYARDLERQIHSKKVREQEELIQRRNFPSPSPGYMQVAPPEDLFQHSMDSAVMANKIHVGHDPNETRRRQYAYELEVQIAEKKRREQMERQERGFLLSPKQQQQDYNYPVVPTSAFASPGVAAVQKPGIVSLSPTRGGLSQFTRFRADQNDPSIQAEIQEKKMKQISQRHELLGQIADTQEKKRRDKEERDRIEREEEARLAKEREEIQAAFEREQAEQKKKQQQEHQEELARQIEEKKRRKEEEQRRKELEEAEDEARLAREREELERRFTDKTQPPPPQQQQTLPEHIVNSSAKMRLFGKLEDEAEAKSQEESEGIEVVPRTDSRTPEVPRTSRKKQDDALRQLIEETRATRSEQQETRQALERMREKLEILSRQEMGAERSRASQEQEEDKIEFERDILGYLPTPVSPPPIERKHGEPWPISSPSPFMTAGSQIVEVTSPSAELVMSLYPNFAREKITSSPAPASPLKSKSSFILPDGNRFAHSQSPEFVPRVAESNQNEESQEGKEEKTLHEFRLPEKRGKVEVDKVLIPPKKESDNFDINRLHKRNRDRLLRLESVGDCSKLRGDQLDAFLQDFLQMSTLSSDNETKNAEVDRSLDCETRWLKKR